MRETWDRYTDHELVAMVKEGREQAFTVLVQRYRDLVFSLAYRMLYRREEALDVTQEVFLRLHLMLPGYRTSGSFAAWLYRLALNRTRDYRRSRAFRDRLRESSLEHNPEPVGYRVQQPDQQLFSREMRQALEQAVADLKDKQREVFLLYYFHHLHLQEIAAATGYSLANVKVLLHRARQALLQTSHISHLQEMHDAM